MKMTKTQLLEIIQNAVKANGGNERAQQRVVESVERELDYKYMLIEVKYFDKKGRNSLPNSVGIVKSGFLFECKKNKDAFYDFDNSIHYGIYLQENNIVIKEELASDDEQYGFENYRGGEITLSTDVNNENLSKNNIINVIKQTWLSFLQKHNFSKIINKTVSNHNKHYKENRIGGFTINSAGHGRYVAPDGTVFDENSITIRIGGVSSRTLQLFGETIGRVLKQTSVLINDLNQNKTFIATTKRSAKEYDLSKINKLDY